ncbi:cytochrome P450 [Hyaloraphidium curvatum]|nr:cytochrome P450 [Hyaloraphidium curvatum]
MAPTRPSPLLLAAGAAGLALLAHALLPAWATAPLFRAAIALASTALALPLLALLGAVAFLAYQNDYVNARRIFPRVKLPLPPTRPVLGPFVPREPHEDYFDWRKLGPAYLRTMLWLPNIDTSEPVDARVVCQQANLDKGPMYRELVSYWGPNSIIILKNGPHHRRQASALAVALRLGAVRDAYHPIFVRHARLLRDRLESTGGKPTDLMPLFDRFSLSVFVDIAFSVRMDGDGAALARFGTDVDGFVRALRNLILGTGNPLFLFPGGGWILGNVVYRSSRRIVDRVLYGLIRERRAAPGGGAKEGRKDMLDILIEVDIGGEKKLTDDEIRDQLLTLAIAGYETTSTCLAWTTHLLAANPKFLAEARDEIRAAFPTPDSLSDPDAVLRGMPFAERCLEESLRLRPPIMAAARSSPEDFPLPSRPEIVVPGGTTINVAWINLHHREDVWGKDALEYNPRREWNSAAFGGFALGPRMCLGRLFALHEMKTALVALLRDRTFALPAPDECAGGVTDRAEMTSTGGILRPRNVWLKYVGAE